MSFWMYTKDVPAYVLFTEEWIDVESLEFPGMLHKNILFKLKPLWQVDIQRITTTVNKRYSTNKMN